jgi:4-diphosphocytidyl-2-C-methyl-D-erythritol kinase
MEIHAPGKINLFLRIGERRADGYHPMWSWMCTVGLFDKLTFTVTPRPGFDLTSDSDQLPLSSDNLVARAAEALKRVAKHRCDATTDGLAVNLIKRIPIGAGLGGGSSDAASTLLALNQLWNLGLNLRQLMEVAAELGSDVPFFLEGGGAFCSGRGDIVVSAPLPRASCCVLFLPGYSLSTRDVYARFDEIECRQRSTEGVDPQQAPAWATLSAPQLMEHLFNDLEEPAFAIRPGLRDLKEDLQRKLDRVVRMSGSGSTLFTLADTIDEGQILASRAALDGLRTMAVKVGV